MAKRGERYQPSEAQLEQMKLARVLAHAPQARAKRSASMKRAMAAGEVREKSLAALQSPEAKRKAAQGRRRPLAERFARHFHPEPNSGCWLWAGALNGSGYGIMRVDGRPRMATHVCLSLHVGPAPFPKAMALHSCDNPVCVNPDHLRWGTAKDNSEDCVKRGRHPWQQKRAGAAK